MTRKRVFLIGWDSAEPELLLQWRREGLLPNLAALLDGGMWGPVRIPPGFSNGAMWPALATSVNPGRFGRYSAVQVRPGSYYDFHFDEDRDFRRDPFWLQLSRAGRKVGVVDMVRMPLRPSPGVFQIVDWTSHDRYFSARSDPSHLLGEIEERFGGDPFGGRLEVRPDAVLEEYRKLRDGLVERVRSKTAASLYLWQQYAPDVLFTVYGDPHDIGHYCWHLHDPAQAGHRPEWRDSLGDPIRDVYCALDDALGEIRRALGPDVILVVFSGPGMGPPYSGDFLLDEILRRLSLTRDGLRIRAEERLRSLYRRVLPARLRGDINRVAGRDVATLIANARARSRFFSVLHNEDSSAVRINLVGREKSGRIQPGEEYDRICRWLARELSALENLDTGQPAVREVVRVADHYRGECLDDLPDLMVVWRRDAPIARLGSPTIGRVSGEHRPRRTGFHTDRALVAIAGPGISPGRLGPEARVEDIGPTVAALLGAELRDVEGTALL